MDGDVETCGFSSGYIPMNSHNDLQQNDLYSLTNDNYRNDKDINVNLQNVYMSS